MKLWNKYAKLYDTYIGKSEKNTEHMNYIKENLKKSDYLYEGACGTAVFSIELSQHVKQIEACDNSENMLKEAKKKIIKENITNINTNLQDITNINYPDNTFDVAIAANVIHLLNKPEKAISELKRVVKKEGIIILPTYITNDKKEYVEKLEEMILKIFGFKANSWTEKEYLEILQKNNLKIIKHKTFKLKRYECTPIIKNDK